MCPASIFWNALLPAGHVSLQVPTSFQTVPFVCPYCLLYGNNQGQSRLLPLHYHFQAACPIGKYPHPLFHLQRNGNIPKRHGHSHICLTIPVFPCCLEDLCRSVLNAYHFLRLALLFPLHFPSHYRKHGNVYLLS